MEEYDEYSGAEVGIALALEAVSVLGGVAILRKLREQGAALPLSIAVGAGAVALGFKASGSLVQHVSKAIRPLG